MSSVTSHCRASYRIVALSFRIVECRGMHFYQPRHSTMRSDNATTRSDIATTRSDIATTRSDARQCEATLDNAKRHFLNVALFYRDIFRRQCDISFDTVERRFALSHIASRCRASLRIVAMSLRIVVCLPLDATDDILNGTIRTPYTTD